MESRPDDTGAKSSIMFPLFQKVLILAALGLCTWAMSQAKNKGRELPGGTTPPPAGP